MSHAVIALVAIAVPIGMCLFGLFALGVITLRKPPPEETAPKPAILKPPPRPKREAPELAEKEKRRAERRTRRRGL